MAAAGNKKPTGEVTFLFTDIVSSTATWEAFPEDMPAALVQHDTLLDEAAASHNGYVFKRVGDAYCVAFQSAIDALQAAVAGQRALEAETWGETGPLRVRMGLHAGIADEREGDYFGPAVNRVARLHSLAHGGQILLSQAVMTLARDHLPQGFDCLELGRCRLKDLSRPELVFQLLAPGLGVDFPPLPIDDKVPANLPKPATPFVGRQAELDQIDQLLGDHRLVTVTGPGGMGKTRLAIEAAAKQRTALGKNGKKPPPRFPDGVYFVPLAAIESPADIFPALNQALNFQPSAQGRSSHQQLLDYLRKKRLLLVLDNFEQLLAGTDLVLELMGEAPSLKILVTSRERLALKAEQLLALQGMDYPAEPAVEASANSIQENAALQLFQQSARSVVPGLELADADVSHATRICRLVDGMPLAIELAAGWVDMLPLDRIPAEIERDLGFLETGVKDVPARHRSVEAVFQGTWRRLEPGEKELFKQLSIFRGGFTLDAAQTIAGATMPQIAGLMRKSLLVYQRDKKRYQIHPLLRQFGARQLAQDREAEAQLRDRHCAYYCQRIEGWARELKGPRQIGVMGEMDLELPNALAAWEEAVDHLPEDRVSMGRIDQAVEGLSMYYEWRQSEDEIEALCRQASRRLIHQSDPESIRLHGRILTFQGFLLPNDEDRILLEEGLARLNEAEVEGLDIRPEKAFALCRLGAAISEDDCEESLRRLEAGMVLYKTLGDDWGVVLTLGNLAYHAQAWGNYSEADKYARERINLCRQLGDRRGPANSFWFLAHNALNRGDLEEAQGLIERGIALNNELDDLNGLMFDYHNLGLLFRCLGRLSESRAAYIECVRIQNDLGRWPPFNEPMISLGLTMEGQYERAFKRCRELIQEINREIFPYNYALHANAMGVACLSLGKRKEAVRWLEISISILGNYDTWKSLLAMTHLTLALAKPDLENVRRTVLLVIEVGSFFIQKVMILPDAALYYLGEDDIERALELYALASRYPAFTCSILHKDLVGRPLNEAAAALPAETVRQAEERGRKRDLETTIDELAAEFSKPSTDGH